MVRQTGAVTLGRLIEFLFKLPSAMIRAGGDMNGESTAETSAQYWHIIANQTNGVVLLSTFAVSVYAR